MLGGICEHTNAARCGITMIGALAVGLLHESPSRAGLGAPAFANYRA